MLRLSRWNPLEQLKSPRCAINRLFGLGVLTLVALALGATGASAQEVGQGAPRWEVDAFPGGLLHFTKGGDDQEMDFRNYALGASITRNFSRYWGVEGEISGGVGVSTKQRLEPAPAGSGQILSTTPSPHTFAYEGNVIVYPGGNDHRFVPYVTGGIGGLSVFFDRAVVPNNRTETYLTGNVGAGAKWFFGSVGLRGDYRLIAVGAKDDAPELFGRRDTRYGHRLSAGVILNLGR